MTNVPHRFSLIGIIAGLMLADHFGDIRDEIDYLHDLAGLPRPEGGFADGWTDDDFRQLGIGPDSDAEAP